jgi:hypothetical protein
MSSWTPSAMQDSESDEQAPNTNTRQPHGTISSKPAVIPVLSSLREAKDSLGSAVTASVAILEAALESLKQPAEIPRVGTDQAVRQWRDRAVESTNQGVLASITALLGKVAAVITMTSMIPGKPVELDFMAIGAAVATITTNMNSTAPHLRLLAALAASSTGAIATSDRVLAVAREFTKSVAQFVQVRRSRFLFR